jgi:uncharacterized protein YjbI with pentapeptide repeats
VANPEHLKLIQEGVTVWNSWRQRNPIEHPDLSKAELTCADMRGANLAGASLWRAEARQADFRGADLSSADFMRARLGGSDFREANLTRTDLGWTDLVGANFERTHLTDVVFTYADMEAANLRGSVITDARMIYTKLRRADFSGATISRGLFQAVNFEEAIFERATISECDLSLSIFVKGNLKKAHLIDCRVFGVSAWQAELEGAEQKGLIVTEKGEVTVTVDDIEVAQFVHLMLRNENIRKVIGTIGRKGVLILGRFTPERKTILESLKVGLTQLGYVPILFDFDRPPDHTFTETIVTLAGMSLFVIADITNPRCSPLELQATVPTFNIPFVPIIEGDEKPFSMFQDLQASFGEDGRGRLLNLLRYPSADILLRVLKKGIVDPAVERARQLTRLKMAPLRTRNAIDLLEETG